MKKLFTITLALAFFTISTLLAKPKCVGLTLRSWSCHYVATTYDQWGNVIQHGYSQWTGKFMGNSKVINYVGMTCSQSMSFIISGGIDYVNYGDQQSSNHTVYTTTNPITDEEVIYTDDGLSQTQITQILEDGGYSVNPIWFNSPEDGLFPCPAPIKDLPVVTPLENDLPVVDPNDYFCVNSQPFQTTSFENLSVEFLKLFPNPNTGQFTINSPLKISMIRFYTITGEKVLEENISDQEVFTLKTRNLNSGIYLIKILTENGIITRKVNIQK